MENYGKPDRSCRIQGDAIIARAMDINAGPAEQRRSGDWGRCARAAQKSEARLKIGSGYNRDDHQAFLTNETSYKACPTPPTTGVASTRQRQAPDNTSQERPLARRTGARDTLPPSLLLFFSPCSKSTSNHLTIISVAPVSGNDGVTPC